jgi:hypothetical protein
VVSQARSGSNTGDGGFLSVEAPSSANCGAADVILTAVGDNPHRVLAWLRALLCLILLALGAASRSMVPLAHAGATPAAPPVHSVVWHLRILGARIQEVGQDGSEHEGTLVHRVVTRLGQHRETCVGQRSKPRFADEGFRNALVVRADHDERLVVEACRPLFEIAQRPGFEVFCETGTNRSPSSARRPIRTNTMSTDHLQCCE